MCNTFIKNMLVVIPIIFIVNQIISNLHIDSTLVTINLYA